MEKKVKYLVDTNIWLERLLNQEKSEIVKKFLDSVPTKQLFISDFAVHSIGVILNRLKKDETFIKLIDDIFVEGQIEMLSLNTMDLIEVVDNIMQYKLDFDDAYQLAFANKYDLTVVTFDKDFNIEGVKKNSHEQLLR